MTAEEEIERLTENVRIWAATGTALEESERDRDAALALLAEARNWCKDAPSLVAEIDALIAGDG